MVVHDLKARQEALVLRPLGGVKQPVECHLAPLQVLLGQVVLLVTCGRQVLLLQLIEVFCLDNDLLWVLLLVLQPRQEQRHPGPQITQVFKSVVVLVHGCLQLALHFQDGAELGLKAGAEGVLASEDPRLKFSCFVWLGIPFVVLQHFRVREAEESREAVGGVAKEPSVELLVLSDQIIFWSVSAHL